ncbi:acyl-CoA synthetase [Nocardioides sp. SYSU DS0651]|uniref:acyl-CoA synthetase n=1 Tax=Nocardioides sp. SYSU DS0651 TaxID=3415955 RepID=UPI003F4BEFE9
MTQATSPPAFPELGPDGFNLATVVETLAHAVPDREALVWRDRRLTFAELWERALRMAAFFHGRGLGCHTERAQLAGHESGQDHVGLYLRNGDEYLPAMLGATRARVAPFPVNYRYVAEELRYLLTDAATKGLVYHSEFAPVLADVLADLPGVEVLVQVPDETGHGLLPGAVWWEEAVGTPVDASALPTPSGDDVYLLYTGGTTGMPKGVLWRNDDIFIQAMGGTPYGTTTPHASYDAVATFAQEGTMALSLLMLPPFIHGAAQWGSFNILVGGGRIVIPDNVRTFDPADVLDVTVREGVAAIPVVGDAILRPILDEIERGDHDLSGLMAVNNGGAPLTPVVRERLLTALPHIILRDVAGSSETGIQLSSMSLKGMESQPAVFEPNVGTAVLDDTLQHVLDEPGDGWLAQRGRVPLGYLGDAAKTARTFPVVDGVRWSVPGDRARLLPDGRVELLGRDSVTINSGGEKIFAEEVERAVAAHPAVRDVIVVGRPSERWGSEAVAVVQLEAGAEVSDEELLAECAKHVARYKVPKAVVRRPVIQRSPVGKADYRWARAQVGSGD